MRILRRPLLVLLGALLALPVLQSSLPAAERPMAPAPTGFADDARLAPVKQFQRRAMLARQKARVMNAIELQKRKGKPAKKKGSAARPPRVDLGVIQDGGVSAKQVYESLRASSPLEVSALGTNVLANNRAGDNAGDGQAEASVAAHGNNILVCWNDGHGFNLPSGDIQGGAYSTNGGTSFTDFGIPPKPANWTWNSDPVITVNERTGTFYYCGLIDRIQAGNVVENGICVVSATFPGGVLTWGTPTLAVQAAPATISFDKQWIAADSTNDSLYLSYTNFNSSTGSQIDFVRSANGTTWSSPVKLSSTAGNGLVHGVRVAVGPNGEVYAVWSEIGPVDVDFFRCRRSDNAGVSFGAEFSLPSYYANFGTGAPGFNRERGITFPSVAVDRSTGANRGKVYVAWNECINWYDDIATPPATVAESEPNNSSVTADPFTLGQRLTGNIASVSPTADQDWFSFSGTQGQDVVLRLIPSANLDLAWRLFCTDGSTQLAISNLGVGAEAYIVFTLPTTATYFIRPAPFSTSGTGTYQIYTKVSVTGAERARDHRDVFVSTSTNRGQTWNTPVRVNQDSGFFDDWLPEVAVGGNGLPYVIWYDWRDTPAANCGGWSHVYLARSDNGGTSWTEVGQVTDTQTQWSSVPSNIAPNQGDYLALFANSSAVYPVWYDGRNGDPDTYSSVISLGTTPTGVSLVAAEATPDQVTLTWSAPGMQGKTANVYRRQAGQPFAAVAAETVDSGDRVVYVDTNVVPGQSYFYRLGVIDGGETFSGETEVMVPTGLDFALRDVGPNPVSSELWVTVSLPVAKAATLALFDITGRQIKKIDLGAQAGQRRAQLLQGNEDIPNGMYIVMLSQDGKAKSARVSIVR